MLYLVDPWSNWMNLLLFEDIFLISLILMSHLLGCGWSLPASFYGQVWCWDCTCPCSGGWWQMQGWRLCQDCGTAAPRLGYTYSNADWEQQETIKRQTTAKFILNIFVNRPFCCLAFIVIHHLYLWLSMCNNRLLKVL